ncbi:hypothetical protein CP02DC21_2186 [Chlamydia psittaci 02DC21]|nr:hypothetical protein CP02DC21_2186 [Chlamydia psittaci 02DC21]EPJ25957.1 hypothetical protein CP03DC29_1469 [Chlamydia psittaci 03DC29]
MLEQVLTGSNHTTPAEIGFDRMRPYSNEAERSRPAKIGSNRTRPSQTA